MAKKKQKRILFLGILSLVFLYPVIYMLKAAREMLEQYVPLCDEIFQNVMTRLQP